jgi:hypothetical protein
MGNTHRPAAKHRGSTLAPAGISRRDFLSRLTAAGMAFGLPPWLSSCGGGGDDSRPQPLRATRQRLLFFNLSGETRTAASEHFLTIAGQRLRLIPKTEAPEVLEQARRSNRFLAALPDERITHHLQADLPADTVALGYVSCMEDPASGTWSMSMMHLLVPEDAHAVAAAQLGGVLPLSAKRRFYGLPAATGVADLREEAALLDSHDHAYALLGVHPELLSMHPASAAYLHSMHIAPNPNTLILAAKLQQLGPAQVQQAAAQPNPDGWATLRPLMNDKLNPPAPYRKSDGKLNLYTPDWHPDVDGAVAQCISAIHPRVRDDEQLGLNVSDGKALQAQENSALKPVWYRHDGLASIARNPDSAAVGEDVPSATFSSLTPETGLALRQPKLEAAGGRLEITLGNVDNWFLRWLGMWVTFRLPGVNGADGDIIPVASLPADTLAERPGKRPGGLDSANSLYVGMLPEVNTIAGIPFLPPEFAPVIRMPQAAASMEIIYGGLGFAGSQDDPEQLRNPGIVATVFINYALVGLFLAAGVQDLGDTVRLVIDLCVKGLLEELLALIPSALNGEKFPLEDAVLTFCKAIIDVGADELLAKVVTAIGTKIAASQLIDSVPVAGQIARALAAAIGALQLAETSLEVAISPPLYRFKLVLTHTLSCAIALDAQFQPPPPGYSLYYKLSYVFDNGSAHVLDAVDLIDPSVRRIPVELKGLPFGGKVNLIAAVYARKAGTPAGQNDWCAAQGSTGLQPNTVDQLPDIAMKNNKVPIQAGTVYIHTRKTALDANGRHVWQSDPDGNHAPPFLPPAGDQQPSLGALRRISVREANASQPGYIGYAWQAFSSGLAGCAGNAQAQLDYLANLNTDAGAAQQGYVNSSCGLGGAADLQYSLLSDDAQNLMLDPNGLYLRPIRLGAAPALPAPGSGALGQLNLAPTRLLLHPSGHAVSINQEFHKLEAVKLPAAPVDDASAGKRFLARTYSGLGSRPGLMIAPVAAAISADGAILVLENSDGNNRIQAFDLGGNAIPYFKKQPRPYFLQLDISKNSTYLDLAVEFSGYLYVLSRDGGNLHWLDIYHPLQDGNAPICRTSGINAARLAVDFMRSVYTLNYDILSLPGGSIPALTEPSVSLWLPPPPTS